MNTEGLVLKNPANTTQGRFPKNYSTFKDSLSYRKWNTLRFGEYTPSFEMEGIESDSISVNSLDLIDSLSLNAPFKGRIRKIKESFKVPYQAILPKNWDLIYVQPSNGDDVPRDTNCVIELPYTFSQMYKSMFDAFKTYLASVLDQETITSTDAANVISALMRLMILGEYVYSHGSLLNVCGYKASAQFVGTINGVGKVSYDYIFDQVMTTVFKHVDSFFVEFPTNDENSKPMMFVGLSGNPVSVNHASFRRFIEMMRENPMGQIYQSNFRIDLIVEGTSETLDYASYLQDIDDVLFDVDEGIFNLTSNWFVLPDFSDYEIFDSESDLTELNPAECNLSRLIAYQLICSHFYSNSNLDAIYTAQLVRDMFEQYYVMSAAVLPEGMPEGGFTRNGYYLPYDSFSGNHLTAILLPNYNNRLALNSANSTLFLTQPSAVPFFWSAWAFLFGFRKSLRYGDYFVNSRPRPLAPINTDVAVNNDMVSVIDVTRKIQAQRFANSVMRTRQKIEDYVGAMFGKKPAIDWHNPLFLSRETDVIFGDAVQNTAETQSSDANSRTANFAGGLGRFTFTFENDDMHPCVYMQIIGFDIKRAYTRSVDRQFLHVDRYDMFNPDFQYIGDQPVYGIELGYNDQQLLGAKMPRIFGYQGRDMEYKQRFDVASGGFVENLPGWCLTDRDQSKENNYVLNSDFIRSYNTELDQFFLSLTGYSLGSYFHFICITDNNVDAKRPMAVDPQILG